MPSRFRSTIRKVARSEPPAIPAEIPIRVDHESRTRTLTRTSFPSRAIGSTQASERKGRLRSSRSASASRSRSHGSPGRTIRRLRTRDSRVRLIEWTQFAAR